MSKLTSNSGDTRDVFGALWIRNVGAKVEPVGIEFCTAFAERDKRRERPTKLFFRDVSLGDRLERLLHCLDRFFHLIRQW